MSETLQGARVRAWSRLPGERAIELARGRGLLSPAGVKTWRWIGRWALMGGLLGLTLRAQVPEPSFPRPGAVVVGDVTGEATAQVGEQRRVLKPDDRLRIGTVISTGRLSLVTLLLSNGATLRLGSESELEVEEFGQSPVSGSPRISELNAEPTLSRTRLRLLRGDVTIEVKPLKVARGSSFHLTYAAGTIRSGEGTFRARVQMSDLALGVATLELMKGSAELELPGAAFVSVPVGRKLAFALEVDKSTGAMKVGEMPEAGSAKKK